MKVKIQTMLGTVFGEVEEGLDVVEMIQGTATGRGDRPVDDIEMRVSVID
ncbi:MAG: peptidylprolyl isomerase [Prevotella sp.]|nr:peptidylprolyl isomerase [Prevotella sp.]